MAKDGMARGKLAFKGDKKKSKKKSKKSKHSLDEGTTPEAATTAARRREQDDVDTDLKKNRADESPNNIDKNKPTHQSSSDNESDLEDLTPAERRSRKFKRDQERREMEKLVSLSHRERVEQFNEKLGSLTELNDIPRVSAAGNG